MMLLAWFSVRLKIGRHELSQHRTMAPVQIMTGVWRHDGLSPTCLTQTMTLLGM